MPTKVIITPNSVKFDDGEEPQPPWIEDDITEVIIKNPVGRDIRFTYPTRTTEQPESD
jgi:hypothetical protein